MLINRLTLSVYFFSKISSSLKLLNLTPPTNKKAIKSKYLELAKQLHPDITTEDDKKKSPQQIKEDSDAFIEITNAYKYLNELSEETINNPDSDDYGPKAEDISPQNKQETHYRPMTQEQRMRRATEAYFNKRYYRGRKDDEMQKVPLYKQLPEMFFSMFLVVCFLVEWAYMAIKSSRANIQEKKGEIAEETFKGMNFKKKYQKNQVLEQN